ncbi:hypothetical protein [Jatrophihabitans endophyticus]|uniref:hypothetical protein n=1 Tax=Jatrophihabitans endophyticus TaxID=1206085 RepID=UPI0019F94AB3|nr:hypothetical protein [Jatrophihabitans endophyticus]MBE7189451.1 hypothetical protein [Jatrophihabitans endophyticus]
MIESGELVTRLRAADDAWSSAQGTSRQWRRPELVQRAFAEHFAHPARQSSWTTTLVSDRAGGGDDTTEAVLSVAFDAKGRRRRAQTVSRRGDEWLPDLVVVDGTTYWARYGDGVKTNDGDERRTHGGTDIVNLLLPSRVPRGYHLHPGDEVEVVAGRPCLVATATPREPDPTGRRPGSQVFDMITGGSVFRLSVDQQLGVLLRVAKLVDDVEAEIGEFLDVTFDAPLDDSLFAPLT